jgi:hypothetical protein
LQQRDSTGLADQDQLALRNLHCRQVWIPHLPASRPSVSLFAIEHCQECEYASYGSDSCEDVEIPLWSQACTQNSTADGRSDYAADTADAEREAKAGSTDLDRIEVSNEKIGDDLRADRSRTRKCDETGARPR